MSTADTKVVLLYAEDEFIIREVIAAALVDAGYALELAGGGKDALAQLDAGWAGFAAVITDINLGEGPDGWAVAKHARELKPEMPIIYITGQPPAEWSAMGVPNSVLVSKPCTPSQVVVALATLLNRTAL
jgi:DNA-binding NtrC family response regulator